MSAFDLTGIVKQCWKYHPIEQDVETYEDEGPFRDIFSSVLKITATFDRMPTKNVKIFFYDEWAIRCQFLTSGDKITLSGSKELLRQNANPEEEGEHMCCIALREDEAHEEPLFIRVSIQPFLIQKNL